MVTETQPEDTGSVPSVVVFSDAPDNLGAIHEIDQWARDNGFVRSREYTLNVKQAADGKRLFYGACYRLNQDDIRASDADIARMRQRRAAMAMTASSDSLLRDGE